jgi:hypothetical protein
MKYSVGDVVKVIDPVDKSTVRYDAWWKTTLPKCLSLNLRLTIVQVDAADLSYQLSVPPEARRRPDKDTIWVDESWIVLADRIGTMLYEWENENVEIAELNKKRDENLTAFFS